MLFKPSFTNGLVVPNGQEIGFDSADIVNFLNVDDSQNDYIQADKALQNSDVYSVVYQLSADLASAVLHADKQQAQAMIDNPSNDWTNAHAFWQGVFAQLLLGGEAFVYRWRNVNGNDQRWEYLRPSQVTVNAVSDYSGLYYNASFDSPDVGYMQAIPANDMIHFRLLSQNGGATGVSPLKALATEFQIKNGSNKLTLKALAQSVMSNGVLKVDSGMLNAKTKSAVSRAFKAQVDNSNGGPIVLDKLSEYQPLELKSDVMSILSQTDWTGKQIAKVYGVPDSVINGTGDQQSSVAMMAGEYAKSLMRFANAVISELKNKLGTNVSIDIKPAIDPVNTDYTTNIATFQSNGMLSPEEAKWLLKNSGYLPSDMPDIPSETTGKEDNQ
ncbi:phage portal protein [Fructobacillus sp. CRL 2054]|uniref:phage portal protein n=1 Tax=Fructobacillus sp. CRL 2054 TaxID=2763007 RepID=UPI0023791DFE|nr:phage portal protein [Fructobacillus sp. CRL 2054]MDD9138319.1 phage portal protein [Fructobacillus sp. CRL 2054]